MNRATIPMVRWHSLFVPVLIAVWLFVPIHKGAVSISTNLMPPEAAELEDCLDKIAQGVALPGERYRCSDLLSRPYPADDWTDFFRDYFSDHVFNQNLWDYLTGPVFWGQGNEAVLQAGLIPVFEEVITGIVTAHPANLGPALASSANTRETLLNANRMFANMAHYGKISAEYRQRIFTFYINHINAFPQYWKKSTTIDIAAQPYVAALAAQIHSNLRDVLPLTQSNKEIIAQTLNLQGLYRDIWTEYSVLLYDNNGFDAPQREFIYHFFNLNPKQLVVVAGISQMEMLGNSGAVHLPILLGGVNVFSTRVGQVGENPFPPDGVYRSCDLFGTVVAHEDYHAVFANYIDKHPLLMLRHNWLIQQAGRDPANYLRGGGPGFFFENPQEFVASLANQWFCSSADMLKLGVNRFMRGSPHGINQALYFAELISVGSSQTWLYTNDRQGNLTRQAAAITRNSLGYINSIVLPDITYRFEVNNDAMVTRIWVDGAELGVDPHNGLSQTLKPGESSSLKFTLRNTGQVPLGIWVEPAPQGLAAARGALHLGGRDGVLVENSSSLNMTNQVTLEAWVYPLTWENPPFSNGRILQKGYGDNQYRLLKEGSAFVFEVVNVGRLQVGTAIPPLNRWTHVAGVYDGQALNLYIDGVRVGQKAASGKINTTPDPLVIGNKAISGSDGFIGYLDDVRVWSVGRTQAQILAGMTGDVPPQTGLVGDWRFNTPGRGPVADSSSSGNPGSLGGLARINAPDGPNGLTARLDWWTGELAPGQSQVVMVRVETGSAAEGNYPIIYQIRASGISEVVDFPVSLVISSSVKPTPSPPAPTPVPTPTQGTPPKQPLRVYLPQVTH